MSNIEEIIKQCANKIEEYKSKGIALGVFIVNPDVGQLYTIEDLEKL